MTADIIICIDDKYICTEIRRTNSGCHTAGTCTDHDDIGLKIPLRRKRRAAVWDDLGSSAGNEQVCSGHKCGGAEQCTARNPFLAHGASPLIVDPDSRRSALTFQRIRAVRIEKIVLSTYVRRLRRTKAKA